MQQFNKNWEFILLNVGYSEHYADWNWENIHSPFARIYYVKEGYAKTKIGDKVYELKPNNLYLTPPFTLHNDECDSHFSLFYIHFYEKVLHKESIFDRYIFPVEVKATDLDYLLTKRLLQINPGRQLRHFDPKLYDNQPSFSRYAAQNNKLPLHITIETQGILYQLTSKFLKQMKHRSSFKDVRISRIVRYIHENTDKDINISKLADIACISDDHFIRIFKKEMNCTPLKYVNVKKIEKAQLLLITTNMSIRDIAIELSIDNISYFNRMFKQYTSKTPVQYREDICNSI